MPNDRFYYYNNNPNLFIENDCVTRSISLVTQKPYEDVADDLFYTGKLYKCEKLNLYCYENLLDHVYKMPKISEAVGMTIEDFSKKYIDGMFLVRVDGHLSAVINGKIYDIWDCSQKIITDCWFRC